MKTFYALILTGIMALTASAASAEETQAAKSRSAKSAPPAAATTAPTKVSQQEKMRLCAKQATGKKGAERKSFMKGCLSKKA